MQQRALGKSGLLVSAVGLGSHDFAKRLTVDEARAVVHKALDLGITFFDTAELYGYGRAEEIIGDALGARRKDVVIATKWGNARFPGGAEGKSAPGTFAGGSREYIMKAVERSLRFLKTDYIDLYQFHRPDPRTPIEETIRALDDIVRQGKVRYVGLSNMTAWQMVEAQLIARQLGAQAFVSFQDAYSMLNRTIETTLFPATDRYGLGLLPYSPLASGMLTGKYRRDAPLPEGSRMTSFGAPMQAQFINDANFATVDRLTDFVRARGHSLLELAMSWLTTRPQVASIIAGATRPEQVEQNVAATAWELTAEDLAEIDRLTGA